MTLSSFTSDFCVLVRKFLPQTVDKVFHNMSQYCCIGYCTITSVKMTQYKSGISLVKYEVVSFMF